MRLAGILVGLLGVVLSASAQDAKPRIDFEFDATQIPAPDPRHGPPVARIFDRYIYSSAFDGRDPALNRDANDFLAVLILRPLLHRLKDTEKLTVTVEEVEQTVQAFHALEKEPPEEDDESVGAIVADLVGGCADRPCEDLLWELTESVATEVVDLVVTRMIAATYVDRWKCDRLLYERYGGTVIFQQANPQEPVGAYLGFLEEAERARVFEIFNADVRMAFFENYHTSESDPFVVPSDAVDFDTPWWRQAVDGDQTAR